MVRAFFEDGPFYQTRGEKMIESVDVVEQFKAMKTALENERKSLYENRKAIDTRITEISNLISGKRERNVYPPTGASETIRALFLENSEKSVSFEEICQSLEGNRNRAGAAVQSLMKSKQLIRSRRGVYRASSKLIEKIGGGVSPTKD
jgi:hypothetical protein